MSSSLKINGYSFHELNVWWELRPLQQLPCCPDFSPGWLSLLDTIKTFVHSISVTSHAVKMGIKNPNQMTLPCLQITKTEETNDLKNAVTLEWKHCFKMLPNSVISKARMIECMLSGSQMRNRPFQEERLCTGRTQAYHTKLQLPLAQLPASSKSVGENAVGRIGEQDTRQRTHPEKSLGRLSMENNHYLGP